MNGIPKEPMSNELINATIVALNNIGESIDQLSVLSTDDNELPHFCIKIIGIPEYNMNFEVYEVTNWNHDNSPGDVELYLTGSIKWDGCSDIYFGDNSDPDNNPGYIHFCGRDSFIRHNRMMLNLIELAENTIPNFNKYIQL